MVAILNLDVEVNNKHFEKDLKMLISHVRDWKPEDIKFKVCPIDITCGLLNLMIIAYHENSMENAIMFRIRNLAKYYITNYLNRENEVKNIFLVKKLHGFAPNILLTFKNGFCYDYIDGQVMTPATIRLDCNWRIIAKQLALLHSTKQEHETEQKYRFSNYWNSLPDIYPDELEDPSENEKFQKLLPCKAVLIEETKLMQDQVAALNCDMVFCHNDFRPENMIWNQKSGEITFVDWETTSLNNQALEIAYHFRNYSGFDKNDFSLKPDKEFQIQWLRVYLESFYSVKNPSYTITNKDVEKLYVQVQYCYLLILLVNVAWSAMIEDFKAVNCDVLELSIKCFKEYRRIKEETLALKLPEETIETKTV